MEIGKKIVAKGSENTDSQLFAILAPHPSLCYVFIVCSIGKLMAKKKKEKFQIEAHLVLQ